jgi:DNA polymerase-4
MEIPFGEEKNFLSPLSIGKIPGIGKQTAILIIRMGVETVKVLSQIPIEMLENLLGKNGIELWRRANALDDTPVFPYHDKKSISKESKFTSDTIHLPSYSELVRMTRYCLRAQEAK